METAADITRCPPMAVPRQRARQRVISAAVVPRQRAARDNRGQFLVHVEVQSVLQIIVEVEEPETLENPTQSFEIHYISRRRTQLLAVIIYST